MGQYQALLVCNKLIHHWSLYKSRDGAWNLYNDKNGTQEEDCYIVLGFKNKGDAFDNSLDYLKKGFKLT
jgi:hypothetical protein